MIRDLYKVIEDIPEDSGYVNYQFFKKGAIVYILDYRYGKFCILCNEEGKTILDNRSKITMYWSPSCNTKEPIWEKKLLPYKTVEVAEDYMTLSEEEEENYSESSSILPAGMDVWSFMGLLECFDGDEMIYLDTNDTLLQKCIDAYGEENIEILMESDEAKLFVVLTNEEETPSDNSSVDDLLNSIDDLESITVNFNN